MSEEAPIEPAELPVLDTPADGLPPIIDTPPGLAEAIAALGGASGPVAVDAERAQGFRYSAKAYLCQFRRAGAGTFLIDPIAFEEGAPVADLSALSAALADAEWIIHAASQDLTCLGEVGLRPRKLFDTELAGRLLGHQKVGLGAMVEEYFGVRLLKEHSAADWSSRPIPTDWIAYAALDVELLIELRAKLAADLVAAGKDQWAAEEFDHLLTRFAAPPAERPDRWRRTSGTHQVRTQRGLALVRELAAERDVIARKLDKGPSRIVPDVAITELAAIITPKHPDVPNWTEYKRIPGFRRRQARQYESVWLDAVDRVAAMPKAELPPLRTPSSGPPQPRTWERVKPEAAIRWALVRPATVALAESLELPVENLISPDVVRQLAWEPPEDCSTAGVDAFLAKMDVRPWQRGLLSELLADKLAEAQD